MWLCHQVLDRLTNESVQLLDVLGQTLHELTELTAPIHSRATALTNAQANINAGNQAVDELLEHLDTSSRVSSVQLTYTRTTHAHAAVMMPKAQRCA